MYKYFAKPLACLALVTLSLPAVSAVVNLASELDPSSEVPPVVAPGAAGSAAMVLDTDTGEFGWVISFEGLTGPATAAHFHNAPVDGTGPVVLDLETDPGVVLESIGSSSGVFAGGKTLDAASVNDILAGLWYINIHTDANPAGEIRGQVLPGEFTPVPLPAAAWLFVSGLAGLMVLVRRKAGRG